MASISPLVIIFVTVFIDLLGFGIIIPLLPFYAESFGASAFTIGLLGTSFSLMQFLFSPIWGRWSDRIGRKPIILVGLMGSCLSYLGLALSTSLTLLFVARIIGGIAGANIPTAQAYIADVTTPENRASGMGMVGAAFGLGFIFGPAIGGVLSRFGPADADVVCVGALLRQLRRRVVPAARIAIGRRVDQEPRPHGGVPARARRKPTLLLLLSLYFIVTLAFSGFEATFALFSEAKFGFTASTIGFVFAFIGVVLAIVQGVLVGKVVKVISERRLIPLAIFAIALGLGLMPFVWNVPTLLVALGVLRSAWASTTRRCRRWCRGLPIRTIKAASSDWPRRSPASAASSVPPCGGYLYDAYGMTTPYLSAAALMLFALRCRSSACERVNAARRGQ